MLDASKANELGIYNVDINMVLLELLCWNALKRKDGIRVSLLGHDLTWETNFNLLTTCKYSEIACLALYLMYAKKLRKQYSRYLDVKEFIQERGRWQLAAVLLYLWSEAELGYVIGSQIMAKILIVVDGTVQLVVDRPYNVGDPIVVLCRLLPNSILSRYSGFMDDDNKDDHPVVDDAFDPRGRGSSSGGGIVMAYVGGNYGGDGVKKEGSMLVDAEINLVKNVDDESKYIFHKCSAFDPRGRESYQPGSIVMYHVGGKGDGSPEKKRGKEELCIAEELKERGSNLEGWAGQICESYTWTSISALQGIYILRSCIMFKHVFSLCP